MLSLCTSGFKPSKWESRKFSTPYHPTTAVFSVTVTLYFCSTFAVCTSRRHYLMPEDKTLTKAELRTIPAGMILMMRPLYSHTVILYITIYFHETQPRPRTKVQRTKLTRQPSCIPILARRAAHHGRRALRSGTLEWWSKKHRAVGDLPQIGALRYFG